MIIIAADEKEITIVINCTITIYLIFAAATDGSSQYYIV